MNRRGFFGTLAAVALLPFVPLKAVTKPRPVLKFRGRVVLHKIISEDEPWFISKVGGPINWDYEPIS